MNIYQKINAVMKEVQYLNKDKTVSTGRDGGSYKALSDEKVTGSIRESMTRNGLVMFPVAQTIERTDEPVSNGRMNRLTTVQVTYRVVNMDDPQDFIEIVSCGTGVDTQDKGIGKAQTYARKYAQLNLFLVPSGNDTDNISSESYTEELITKDDKKALLVSEIKGLLSNNEPVRIMVDKFLKGQSIESLEFSRLVNLRTFVIKSCNGSEGK